jgi:hypothetical protein
VAEVNQDIKKIVSSTIKSIDEGLKDTNCMNAGVIEFELSVIKEANAGGGFDFRIVEASGKANEKHVSKIKFYVVSKDVRQYKDFGKILPSTT